MTCHSNDYQDLLFLVKFSPRCVLERRGSVASPSFYCKYELLPPSQQIVGGKMEGLRDGAARSHEENRASSSRFQILFLTETG